MLKLNGDVRIGGNHFVCLSPPLIILEKQRGMTAVFITVIMRRYDIQYCYLLLFLECRPEVSIRRTRGNELFQFVRYLPLDCLIAVYML